MMTWWQKEYRRDARTYGGYAVAAIEQAVFYGQEARTWALLVPNTDRFEFWETRSLQAEATAVRYVTKAAHAAHQSESKIA